MMSARTITQGLVGLAAALLTSCRSAPDYTESDLYHSFALIDPEGQRVVEDAYVVVEAGRITAIGVGEVPRGEFKSRRDLAGRWGLPGFVDAHAHITAGPHAMEVTDGTPVVTIESDDDITPFSARMALAFGVTTVRNPGGDPVANARYDRRVAAGTWIGPDAVHAGAVVQPPPFGGNAFVAPRTDQEWHDEAARQADLGMRYFKLYVSLTEDQLATGIRAAHANGLRAIAHLNQVSWTRAVELGIDDLTHALPTSPDLLLPAQRQAFLADPPGTSRFMYRWFELVDFDSPPLQALISLLAERQVRVDLTMIVNEIVYNGDGADSAAAEAMQRYSHRGLVEAAERFARASATGWTPTDYDRARAAMPKVLAFARRLHQAGVPLLIGTDGHGGTPWYARELQLHVDAGIPIWDVLRLATSQGARRLDLGAVTGRFDVGLEADMVFLNRNPLDDVGHVREVDLVVTNGNAYTFGDLTADVATAH